MLQIQKEYINYINSLKNELIKVDMKSSLANDVNLGGYAKLIKNTELIIPVIGAFSAGKSTLINSFLDSKILPENITPETALATELRYSDNERIEAVNKEGNITTFSIDEIDKIKESSSEFKYLKVYLLNENLKNIEPLILVDMPGFESPLDLHNQAIMEYINKGVHYIVLTSVEDGTITRSMERQLRDIQEFGRDFSFFLSKSNLRADSEVKEVANRLQEQIEDYFDIQKEVVPVDDNGGESLKKILLSIDPEEIFKSLFVDVLKENFFTITEMLNITISALGNDKKRNEEVIQELQDSLVKIQQERDHLIEEAQERYSNTNVNRIVEAVGRELTNSLDELVNAGIVGGQDAMSQLISEIVRHSLIVHIKDSMSNISDEIVDSFSINLVDLNSSMSEFTLSENWLGKITDTAKNMLNNAKGSLDGIIENRQKNKNAETMYKAITSVLAITTTVLEPIVEVIIVFLPEILGGLLENYQKQKQKEQLQSTILTQVIPSLKRELRTKLPEIFNQQVQEMIKDVSEQFEQMIEEKREVIEKTQKEIDTKNIDLQKEIEVYQDILNNITVLTNQTLYKTGEEK